MPVFHFTKEVGEHILGDSRSLYVAAFSPALALSLQNISWFLFLHIVLSLVGGCNFLSTILLKDVGFGKIR